MSNLQYISWVKQHNAFGSVSGTQYSICVDISGNSYVAYQTNNPIEGATQLGTTDIVVYKVDVNGAFQWAKQTSDFNFATTSTDRFQRISVDSAGNCYLVYPQNGIVVVKLDTHGVFQWRKKNTDLFNTSGGSSNPSISADTTGNCYIAYETTGAITDATTPNATTTGGIDIVVFKLNTSGNLQWVKQSNAFNAAPHNMYPTISVDASANCYISYSTTTLTVTQVVFMKGVNVFKLNTEGNLMWLKINPSTHSRPSYSGLSYPEYVYQTSCVDPSGNCYVAYSATGNVTGGTFTGRQRNVIVFKLDTDGILKWEKQEPSFNSSIGSNDFSSITADSSGNCYIAYNARFLTGLSLSRIALFKLNTNGTFQWILRHTALIGDTAVTFGGAHDQSVYADQYGNCYMAYWTNVKDVLTSTTVLRTAFIAKFSPVSLTYTYNNTQYNSTAQIPDVGRLAAFEQKLNTYTVPQVFTIPTPTNFTSKSNTFTASTIKAIAAAHGSTIDVVALGPTSTEEYMLFPTMATSLTLTDGASTVILSTANGVTQVDGTSVDLDGTFNVGTRTFILKATGSVVISSDVVPTTTTTTTTTTTLPPPTTTSPPLYRIITVSTVAVSIAVPNGSYEVVISESVTYNGGTYSVTGIDTAGQSNPFIFGLTIPKSVTFIGADAFKNCVNLRSVAFPGKSQLLTIGASAFEGTALTSFTIPQGVTSIGEKAFFGVAGLTFVTIPDSVSTIGNNAFPNVTHVTVSTAFANTGLFTASKFPNLTSITTYGINAAFNNFSEVNISSNVIVYTNALATLNTSISGTTNDTAIRNAVTTALAGTKTIAGGLGDGYTPIKLNKTDIDNALSARKVIVDALYANASTTSITIARETQVIDLGIANFSDSASGPDAALFANCEVKLIAKSNYPIPLSTIQPYLRGYTGPMPMTYTDLNVNDTQLYYDSAFWYYEVELLTATTINVKVSQSAMPNYIIGTTITWATNLWASNVSNTSLIRVKDGNTYAFDIGSWKLISLVLRPSDIESITNGTIQVRNSSGQVITNGSALSSLIGSGNYTVYQQVNDGCLLQGTRVKTPNGDVHIETLRKGDFIINQRNEPVLIEKLSKAIHNVKTVHTNNVIYKIPAGTHGARTDVYLTKGHRVMKKNGNVVLPEKLGFLPAPTSEYCDERGDFIVYHIGVNDGERNHLVVNGACIVESWK